MIKTVLLLFIEICIMPGIPYVIAGEGDEVVETLDTIEVPGTAVREEERHISLPEPNLKTLYPLQTPEEISSIPLMRTLPASTGSRVVIDHVASIKAKQTQVRPAKAERPPYPHVAREQGWEGTVVLRLHIRSEGTIASITIQKSSGYPLLDESAEQAVQQWHFEPAKDGEIPIPVTVDLPIRFDLNND